MSAAPILQRPIAFALAGSEFGTDQLEWHDLDLKSLDDARRPTVPGGGNTEGAGLWWRTTCILIRPEKTGSCTLEACEYKVR